MKLKLADRVLETSTTQGAAAIVLAGPVPGFESFVFAIGDGNKTAYFINEGNNWEIGIGTVVAGTSNTLTRDDVIASSNNDALINWGSGVRNVMIAPAAFLAAIKDDKLNFIEGYCAVTGSANALILASNTNSRGYSDGMLIRGFAITPNTAAAITVNVNGFGNKNLKYKGADPGIGAFSAGTYFEGHYRASSSWFELSSPVPSLELILPSKAKIQSGMQTSINVTDADNDIDIAAGQATDDTGKIYTLSSALTKRLDAVWAAGNNAGGRFNATRVASWYHLWLIRNNTTGVIDAGFDSSSTAANIPAGWTKVCRIWSVYSSATVLRLYSQIGNVCRYTPTSVGSGAGPRSGALIAVDTPTGFITQGAFKGRQNVPAASGDLIFVAPGFNSNFGRYLGGYGGGTAIETDLEFYEFTNTSNQIYYGISNSNGWGLECFGYTDNVTKE